MRSFLSFTSFSAIYLFITADNTRAKKGNTSIVCVAFSPLSLALFYSAEIKNAVCGQRREREGEKRESEVQGRERGGGEREREERVLQVELWVKRLRE